MKNLSILLLVIACLFSTAPAADLPPTAQLVSSDTILLVEVDDLSDSVGRFEQTDFGKLCKDPSMKAFVDELKVKFMEMVESDEMSRTLADKFILPDGRIALAVGHGEDQFNVDDISVMFIAQWSENTDGAKEMFDEFIEKGMEEKDHVSKEEYYGVEITHITWPEGEDATAMDQMMNNLSHCFVDDVLLIGNDPDMVKFAVAHIKGASGKRLSETESYITSSRQLGSYNDLRMYINLGRIVSLASNADTEGKIKPMLTALGVDNLDCMDLSLGLAPEAGISYASKGHLKTKGPMRGIFKIFEMHDAPFNVPAFVDPEVCDVSVINWDLKAAFKELFKVLAGIQPMFAAMIDSPLTPVNQDGSGGIKLSADILAHLGSQFVVTEKISVDSISENALPQFGVYITADNTEALERSLATLHSLYIAASNADSQREMLGHTVYEIALPSLFMSPPAGSPGSGNRPMADNEIKVGLGTSGGDTLAFTVTDTHLVIGVLPVVEQVIRSTGDASFEGVQSKQWYQKAKSSVKQSGGWSGFRDYSLLWRTVWAQLKSGDLLQPPGAMMLEMEGDVADSMDEALPLDKLPEFDQVRKYFGLGSAYGQCKEDGYYFESYGLDSLAN